MATGTDMIGPCLLKLSAQFIAVKITFICNHSICSSFFPSKWKEAKVAPIYKNAPPPPEEVNNYRPISILPVLSKVLENMFMTIFQIFYINTNYYIKHNLVSGHSIHVKLPL